VAVKPAATPSRVPVQERGRRKREKILRAALECFSRTGFRGTDLKTVAAAAGTNAPHVLYYFGSKETLAWELVETANAELRAQAAEFYSMEATEGLPLLPDLGRLIEEQPAPAQLNAVLLAENLTSGPLHDHFKQRLRRLRSQMALMIERGQAAGTVRADVDAQAEATDAIAFLEGLIYHHLVDEKRVSIEAGLRRYVRRLLRDIRA
jgi:AcrR family transcriptional regulator